MFCIFAQRANTDIGSVIFLLFWFVGIFKISFSVSIIFFTKINKRIRVGGEYQSQVDKFGLKEDIMGM